jgi:hypothetical protein
MNLLSAKFKITKVLRYLCLVCSIGMLSMLSFPVAAVLVSTGSAAANSPADCVPGTEERDANNWVRACVLLTNQSFSQFESFNPGSSPITKPVNCPAGVLARFHEYGWLLSC